MNTLAPSLRLPLGLTHLGDSTIDALAMLLPEQTGLELTQLAEHMSPQLRLTAPGRVLQSLLLRQRAAITTVAAELVESTLFGPDRPAARRAAEVAIALACTSGHQLDHQWLHTTLASLPMYQRDMTWTAATAHLRSQRMPTPYGQLLHWVDTEDEQMLAHLSPDSARAVATTLMWAFPSPDRFLRDQATRRLVKLVSIHPELLPLLLQDAIDVDDPYVLERVCAVVYGVALRGLPDSHLGSTADVLVDLIFARGKPPAHILVRDYARGTVRLAHQRGLVSDAQWKAAEGPWSSPWPGRDLPSIEELEARYPLFAGDEPGPGGTLWASIHLSVMEHGDFARYEIGTDSPSNFPFSTRPLADLHASNSGPSESDQSTATPRPPSLLEQFVHTLPETDPLHSSLADLLAHAESLAADDPADLDDDPFDTELVGRFVFLGVVDRGWTPERFRDIDHDLDDGSNGRSSHKRERIGKKYQWLAWHEALARLADTYHLRRDTHQQPIFTSTAQIPFVRDLDPSHLLAGNPEDLSNPFNDEETSAWWLALPEPQAPDLSTFDSQRAWVSDQTAFRDTTDLIKLSGPVVAGTTAGTALALPGTPESPDWILIHGTVAWYWDPYGRTTKLPSSGRWADHALLHHTVLIRQQDVAAALDSPPQRYRPNTYSQSFTDGPFLGEFPDQPAFTDLLAVRRDETPDWNPNTGIPAPVLLTTDQYVWEGSVYDCSLHHTVSVTLPNAALLHIIAPHARPRDGAVYTSTGEVIAFAPDVYDPGQSALLIRADTLHHALLTHELALGRVIFQEHRTGTMHQHRPFPGEITRTSLHIHTPTPTGWTTAGTTHHDEIIPPRLT